MAPSFFFIAALFLSQQTVVRASPISNSTTLSGDSCPHFIRATPSATATITAAPTKTGLSCTLQPQDPDNGVDTAYCLCDGSKTLPVQSVGTTATGPDASCAYTNVPASTTKITEPTEAVYTSDHQICSVVGANNAACTDIAGQTPTILAAPTMKAVSSNRNISFGTWQGSDSGEEMFNTITGLLLGACPDPPGGGSYTECDPNDVDHSITYVDPQQGETGGTIRFNINISTYNDTNIRNAMIATAAAKFANSTSGKNCGNATWKDSVGIPSDPMIVPHNYTSCVGTDTVMLNYFPAYNTDNAEGQMVVAANFVASTTPSIMDLLDGEFCDLLVAVGGIVEGTLAPEALPFELSADTEFENLCNEVTTAAKNITGS